MSTGLGPRRDQVEKFEIVEWLIETAHWKVLKLGGHQSSENSPLPSPVSVPVNWLHNHSQDNHQTTVLKIYKKCKTLGKSNEFEIVLVYKVQSYTRVITPSRSWLRRRRMGRSPSHSSSCWLLLCWMMLQSLITPTALLFTVFTPPSHIWQYRWQAATPAVFLPNKCSTFQNKKSA